MPHKLTVEYLEMLNDLVQDGLIDVVSIDAAGEPSYRIASRFLNPTKGPGGQPEALSDEPSFGGSNA